MMGVVYMIKPSALMVFSGQATYSHQNFQHLSKVKLGPKQDIVATLLGIIADGLTSSFT